MSNKTGVATAAEFGAADGGVLTADFVDVDGGALVTTPADAGPGVYSVAVRDESPCSSGSPRRIELVSSPVLASYTFDVDRQNVAFTTLTSETGQPPVGSDSWSATAGNPGGAVIATAFGGPPQYFQLVNGIFAGDDLGVLRFDLNACPFAAGDPLPQVQVKLIGSTLNSRDFTLSRPFDSPACAYTHYDVPLGGDGWTYADASGSRPATALDFAQISANSSSRETSSPSATRWRWTTSASSWGSDCRCRRSRVQHRGTSAQRRGYAPLRGLLECVRKPDQQCARCRPSR